MFLCYKNRSTDYSVRKTIKCTLISIPQCRVIFITKKKKKLLELFPRLYWSAIYSLLSFPLISISVKKSLIKKSLEMTDMSLCSSSGWDNDPGRQESRELTTRTGSGEACAGTGSQATPRGPLILMSLCRWPLAIYNASFLGSSTTHFREPLV